jgi:translation initiation factor 1 (eIF-1/SUI1)
MNEEVSHEKSKQKADGCDNYIPPVKNVAIPRLAQENPQFDTIEHIDGQKTEVIHMSEDEHKTRKHIVRSVEYIHQQHINAEKMAKHWKHACSLCHEEEKK